MGEFANGFWIKLFGWTSTLLIITLNVKLLFDTFLPTHGRRVLWRARSARTVSEAKNMFGRKA